MNDQFPDPLRYSALGKKEIASALDLLVESKVSEESKSKFLRALHQRGETARELAGFAEILLERAVQPEIDRSHGTLLIELCGTGGDRAGFLNISTAAMFVVAGAGAHVVKHGNRAVSSRCGSADVLEALGVSLHLKPASIGEVLERAGCVFLLASDFHPAVAAVAPLRRSLAAQGQMTIFNLLGPLLNPAKPDFQLTGIYRAEMLPLYATAMGLLGRKRAWAVHGEGGAEGGGVDELSITGSSRVVAVSEEDPILDDFVIRPDQLGFEPVTSTQSLLGGDASANAGRIQEILSGKEKSPARDMIILNAAAALHLAGKATTLLDAIALAAGSLDSGAAAESLSLLRDASQEASLR